MDPLAHLQTALSERYRVEKLIGVGGMATVYLARDLRHDRNVALKLLKPELGAVALRITAAVAGALDYAHRHNVVHRDLKPENILLQGSGDLRVLTVMMNWATELTRRASVPSR